MTVGKVVVEVVAEVTRAQDLFPFEEGFKLPHYQLGVIEEEFEEFRKEVFAFNIRKGRDTRPAMRAELIQLAAMAVRAILDMGIEK